MSLWHKTRVKAEKIIRNLQTKSTVAKVNMQKVTNKIVTQIIN